MTAKFLWLFRLGAGLALLSLAVPRALAERMSFLDNGALRIGVDLDIGGTITHLSAAGDGENLINSHDLGRQIQQSYYSGPQPFGQAHPNWKNWPWNPIGSGDVYGNPSRTLKHSNDGQALYVKSRPMQWALNNVPGDCSFETWIRLDGPAAVVRCRLSNHRDDKTQYPAADQELPAVYTIGELHRLFTYDGPEPFTGGELRRVENSGPPWASWRATENWAALVNNDNWGVGVVHPGVYAFIGGFHGEPGRGGPKDNPTGYIAPTRREILDHNVVYEYEYVLVLGTLDEIRAQATARRVRDGRPDYHFKRGREHWTFANAVDAGFPSEGGLRVRPRGGAPRLIGPEQWWEADSAPRLFIRAGCDANEPAKAALYWRTAEAPEFSPERRVEFVIKPDGELRDHELDLAAHPEYRGTITGLRIDPIESADETDEIRVEFISWKKP